MAPRKVYVIGVGMTKFEKPQSRENFDYPEMAKEAMTKAFLDAGINFDKVEQAAVGYCFGDSTCGQRAVYQMGLTQIPIMNVNNNCSTGSSALYMIRQAVEGGVIDCGLALGFERMQSGPLGAKPTWTDREGPIIPLFKTMAKQNAWDKKFPSNPQIFGYAGLEHMQKYGTTVDHFAKIGHKNHKHSTNNPYAQFQKEYSFDEVKNGRKVWNFLSLLQCCPTSDGAGAAILASEDFVIQHNLQALAVEIVAQAMATDAPKAFDTSAIELVGAEMTRLAAKQVFKKAGVTPNDIQVVELHDCFSANELVTYEALGLCEVGKAGEYIDKNQNTYGGKHVVNPSGGLISKGHPLGATGLAQTCEMVWQVRGWCGKRQVPNVKYALAHNVGLGGAVVVTIYKKGFNVPTASPSANLGYNAAVECKTITVQDFAKARSAIMSDKFLTEQDVPLKAKL